MSGKGEGEVGKVVDVNLGFIGPLKGMQVSLPERYHRC